MKIFFDVDGVLIDNIHHKRGWLNRWDKTIEADLGIDLDAFQKIFQGWFLEVLQGRLDFHDGMEGWLRQNGYDLPASQVIDYWHAKDSVLNEGLWEVVRRLSARGDLELYIATNQTHERARHLWEALGFKDHFKDIYYSARLGCLKHDENYFREIEQELGFDPRRESVLYFDDDPKNIDVSSKRGWNAVLFDTERDVREHPLLQSYL